LRAEVDEVLHREFVAVHDIEAQEEVALRRVLEEHLHFTGSPRASRLLSRRNGLPFVRVQPVHLQASVGDTWKPVLARFKQREALLVGHGSRVSPAALHA
jgi:glutamate synthase domain-containing protein 3